MVVFSLFLCKVLEWLVYTLLPSSFHKLTKKIKRHKQSSLPKQQHPILTKTHVENFTKHTNNTLVVDINGGLLKSSTFFPFFMLVAFEGGSVLRATLLLLSYPLVSLLTTHDSKMRVLVFLTFFGMKVRDMESVGRAVLPKFFLEDINPLVYEMWEAAEGKVVATSVPKVMIEWFCREYLGADEVLGTELHSFGGFYSGFVGSGGVAVKHRAVKAHFGDTLPDVCIGISSCSLDHLFLCHSKEAYVVTKETLPTEILPPSKYPKPLIFHDGRLAFLPTPAAFSGMLLFLPLAIPLSLLRLLIGCLFPPHLSHLLGSLTGVRLRHLPSTTTTKSENHHVLYVSNHRTLLDPVMLGIVLRKPLTAVTYSLSRLSEIIAPIPTVRLTRDRTRDGLTMLRQLAKGDVVVCPEGTTCREPYLLRFSSLFAELTDEIVPVAVEAEVSMFYGTTASGAKWLDPIFFFMNPSPGYVVRVLEKVAPERTCGGGGRRSVEVANWVQAEIGRVLGFECTQFTRKDKYMMLAGNEGIVGPSKSSC